MQNQINFRQKAKVPSVASCYAFDGAFAILSLLKANYVPAHKVIIAKMQKHWPEFAESGRSELDDIFAFREERLAGHQSFITVAFLSHLINPEQVEIIDQHNF
jgi:hypothetical protein